MDIGKPCDSFIFDVDVNERCFEVVAEIGPCS